VSAIGRTEITAMIPHAGAMCLLDRVLDWSETAIRCAAVSHRARDNPLRRAGRLDSICGIEFAAQAMAVHGRLAGAVAVRPQAGYLVSVRDVRCEIPRLDLLEDDLIIAAERLMGDAEQVIYQFTLAAAEREILGGRAAVVLMAAPA